MFLKHINTTLYLCIFCFISLNASAAIKSQTFEYSEGQTKMKGYLAWDDSFNNPRPGVLVVHEWWGHNDYAQRRARMLAEAGYLALAIDMYGDGKVTRHPDKASEFSKEALANLDVAEKRFEAAANWLNKHPLLKKNQISAIGYCFGGIVVLHMARAGSNLKAVASFHGNLGGKIQAEKDKVKAKILVLHGADDPFIPQEKVKAFELEMKNAEADFKVIQYPGATHSFTNPAADEIGKEFNLPLAYDEEADKKSWQALLDFLSETFNSEKNKKDHP